jgi:hypothetical protein
VVVEEVFYFVRRFRVQEGGVPIDGEIAAALFR